MTIAAIIPALNEEETIGGVLSAFPAGAVDEIFVVDNGSSDATAQIAAGLGATVVSEKRRGYGYACYAGAQAAQQHDILVFLDGDGADDPAEIPLLVAPIADGTADMVLGSRTRGQHDPDALLPHAHFGNWLVSRLMRLIYKMEVTDLGPFRAIKQPVFASLNMREMTFGWTTEMMVKAAREGYRIHEIPISYHRRAGGRSKISGTVRGSFLAAYHILKTTLRYAR
jgi:glycosyltransferase involved in cell wall biosynthesis